ncbi:MAG: hypothetical protein ABT27_07585 [Lysobacteraceae bacterium SCN 69-25]|nr:MAG: hypothetical protein ABT27_07585 [Xanthomonadaceae bacterium SCN 69-25]
MVERAAAMACTASASASSCSRRRAVSRGGSPAARVQQQAELVDVGLRRDRAARELFGRGVFGRQQRAQALRRVLAGMQQLGDAEVEQLDLARACDEHVGRLEVAMHDQIAMRMRDRLADLDEQRQTRVEIQAPRVAPGRQRLAVDEFHREPRTTVLVEAAVDQACDVRMFQPRQDFALAQEAREHFLGIHAALDALERDRQARDAGHRLGPVHRAHAAAAEAATETERADLPARQRVAAAVGRKFAPFQRRRRRVVEPQQRQCFGAQRRIVRRAREHERLALRGGAVQRLAHQSQRASRARQTIGFAGRAHGCLLIARPQPPRSA